MTVNCWWRVLLVFEMSTPRQLCSNGSPWPSEVLDGLSHSLSVDLSNTPWAQAGLINELSKNAFGTVTRIRPWKSMTQPDTGFSPKNHKQDLTLKTHGQAMVLHLVPWKHIKHIVVSWQTIVIYMCHHLVLSQPNKRSLAILVAMWAWWAYLDMGPGTDAWL